MCCWLTATLQQHAAMRICINIAASDTTANHSTTSPALQQLIKADSYEWINPHTHGIAYAPKTCLITMNLPCNVRMHGQNTR